VFIVKVTIAEQIANKDKSPKNQKPKKKKEEKVNWIDIMGMNRPTYKRVGGAVRRK
jgi:hypothetical protein